MTIPMSNMYDLANPHQRLEIYKWRYPFHWTTPFGSASHLGGNVCGNTHRVTPPVFDPNTSLREDPCELCRDYWRSYVRRVKDTTTGTYDPKFALSLFESEFQDKQSIEQKVYAMRVVVCLMLDATDTSERM